MVKNYNPFVTAKTRKGMSKPTRILFNKDLLVGKVLDYGCGKGKDTEDLKALGIDIKGYDKYNEDFKNEDLLKEKYDTVICNYVFNVIADLEEHKGVLEQLKSIGDTVYISVRTDSKARKDKWVYDEERKGYWTNNTFQRFYTTIGLTRELFGDIEFISDNQSYKLFKVK